MWPFKKKANNDSFDVSEHKWVVAETTSNEQPFFIRFNSSVTSKKLQKSLPIKVGFAIHLQNPSDEGLPQPEELQELDAIEDRIISLINGLGVQVLSLTTGGIREFICYVKQGSDIAAIHTDLLENITTHKVQCMAVNEPDWGTYYEYTPS